MSRCQWIIAILLVCGFYSSAQVLTLDSMMRRIDERNLMLKEYDSKVRAIGAYAEGTSTWMAPMVGVGTFMTPYPNQMLMEESDKGALMFSVEQDIPNPAKLNANKRYVQSRAGIERENRAVLLNRLKSEGKLYYFESLIAIEKLKVLQESDRIMDMMLRVARVRYPYNQGSLSNIYKAEGRRAEVENMKLMTLADLEERQSRINALMNGVPTDSIVFDTTVTLSFDVNRIAQDTIALDANRSDLRQIDQVIENMRLNQKFQRSQARPDFRLKFDHMQPLGNMPTQFSAMAMVSIPIAPWSSKMYKAEVKGMDYDIAGMQTGRRAILNEVRGMLIGMSRQILRMKEQLKNYEDRIVPALRKNYEATMLAYEENKEELPMVIDAWEAMNMAQLEALDKRAEYYRMIVEYEKQLEK